MRKDTQIPAFVSGEIGLVRSLGEVFIPVYVGSYYKDNIAYYSRYCKKRVFFEHSLSRDFVDQLIAFGKSEGRKMVFFTDDDRAVLTFSQYRKELEPYYYFNMPDAQMVETILDKRKFAVYAEQLGLPVPKTFMPTNVEELKEAASKIGLPCILKPVHKDDWWNSKFSEIVGDYKKAILCADMESLIDYFQKVIQVNPRVVMQEYIEGDDFDLYSVNIYHCMNSSESPHFIGHKLRIYPIHAGVGSVVECIRDDEISSLALEVSKKMNLRGHVNIQFKRDRRNGNLKIMEMHTRNSLWTYLSTGSGQNLTALAYYDMINEEVPFKSKLKFGVKWVDFNKDLKALLGYRKTGEWTISSWLKSFKGPRVFHIHSLVDPMPLFVDSWFVFKRYLSSKFKQGAAPHE